ncbi:hypothetical protein [Paenibacillus radicis (ex Xue et al. 2023)]|uniref:Uncharacterized protein n=1 Tax=Paenibacillus radicis (ex Xue et al. 2023) TaxID=2972489 RepID=A0ABT1YSB5_9BACL|nr:hypothetical protein [Paenibacillus radicis (ex Xue et al. 2023)]MCR8634875.1 hypothetical protein [Paenibacillus radicis (ex Xue et al. 2023)]
MKKGLELLAKDGQEWLARLKSHMLNLPLSGGGEEKAFLGPLSLIGGNIMERGILSGAYSWFT